MRVSWFIPLAWIGIFLVASRVDNGNLLAASSLLDTEPGVEILTNITGCLNHVRSHPHQPACVRMEASITLVDRERSLLVVQAGSAAMAIYTPLDGLNLQPGQRVAIAGGDVRAYVRAFPSYPDQPAGRAVLGSFEAPSGHGTYFLSRFRGWLHPPVSGPYTFWISADDAGEFFLSPDASPEKAQLIASNKIGNATGPLQYDAYTSQRSQPVTLQAGESYYVEALQVQGYGRDYLAVAWAGPEMERSIITGRYLAPWVEASEDGTQPPANGVLREHWTNFLANSFDALEPPSPAEPMVRIRSLKLTVTGAGDWPVPQPVDENASLDTIPNLRWVELEGEVNFAGGSQGKLQFELKRGDSVLGVQVLDGKGLPTERLVEARVRVRGILEHVSGPKGELTSVMWVPDGTQISWLNVATKEKPDLDQVSICEIEPSNPEMSWGRRVSVRGRICDRTTNGLVVVAGADNYQAFCSVDGINWVSLGRSVEIGMSNSVLTGLALASHATANPAAGSFAHLQGFGTNWQGNNIGKRYKASSPDSFTNRDGVLTLNSGGRQIGERADQQYYLYQPLEGAADISAQVTLPQLAVPRAQIGLMVRESLDFQAPYAAVLFTPAHGPAFQYRLTSSAPSLGFEADAKYRNFHWLKLIKRKSLLLVQGDPGAAIEAGQDLQITGTITWQNETPVLTETFFQAVQKVIPSSPPVVSDAKQSIADFVFRAQHPPEPFAYTRMSASHLRGIVTFCGDYLGQTIMFIQAGNEGGIRVAWSDATIKPAFKVGQWVEMHGYANVREFPVVFDPLGMDVAGWGTLPEPQPYSPVLVKNSTGQARWVEATGVIRSVAANGLFNLMTKDGPLAVWIGDRPEQDDQKYVNTLVRLRGVLSLDSVHAAQLLVPSPNFVEIQEPAPADPFAIPSFTIAQLGTFDLKPERLRKMKLAGVVTCTLPEGIYVQDDTAGAYVQTGEAANFQLGDRVVAVGFPNHESAMVVVSGASVRKTGRGSPPNPIPLALDGPVKFAGMLVTSEAVLLGQCDTRAAQLLTLQVGTKILKAVRIADAGERLPPIPTGSRVGIVGVCQQDQDSLSPEMLESEAAAVVTPLTIWLPNSNSIMLLERPPWWTLKRVAWIGGVFAFGLLVTLAWVRMLRRRVAERTQALQVAMQQLEKETRHSAILAERDRLAGEIHDSLEQGLTAVMLQLDAASKHVEQPPEARKYLRMARNMAEFSRAEIQHAVWDMQSPLLANADLAMALKHVVSQISAGTTEVKIEILGQPVPLPSSHEHHLLRMAQEAITNALKHAQPRTIHVVLDYSGPELKLTITDDGSGFISSTARELGQNGHFGLQGIRSRAKKIAAQLDITSQVGQGTKIAIRLKLNPAPTESVSP